MKPDRFCIIMNFVAALSLIGAGSDEMNNLGTSIPAILCLIAGIRGLYRRKK